MPSRLVNRRTLRQPLESPAAAAATAVLAVKPKKAAKLKAAAAPKPRKPRAKKAPLRMYARWGVFDGGMKQVAIFDYNQRVQADQKMADLNAKKKSVHFLQIVKEPMPEPVAAVLPLT